MTSELGKRVRTGGALSAGILALGVAAHYSETGLMVFVALTLAAVLGCAAEFSRICAGGRGAAVRLLYGAVAGFAPLIASLLAVRSIGRVGICGWNGCAVIFALTVLSFVLAGFSAMLTGRKDKSVAAAAFRDCTAGTILIGVGGMALVLIPVVSPKIFWMLWFIAVICLNDIAAYFVGRKVGGPKLAEGISPAKTISGSVGGVVCGAAAGMSLKLLLAPEMSVVGAGFLAVGLILAAQLGDLTKSLLKRVYDLKDCGSILPGHGGLLDRMDAVLLSAPVFLVYLILFVITPC